MPSPEGFRPESFVPHQRAPETHVYAPHPQGPPEWDAMPERWGSLDGSGPAAPPPPRGNRGLVIAIIAIVAVLLLAGGGIGWFLWQRSKTTTPGHPVASASATAQASNAASASAANSGVPGGASAKPTATKAPEPPTEAQALAQLNSLRSDSLKRVPLDGRWVAQVASKWVGVTDPLQTAANGSHTFQATDILTESQAARTKVDDPKKVYVLWGTDFGKRSTGPNGAPIWVTIVDAGYASHDNVLEWCRVKFPGLSPQQLADTCAPRQLTPPHN
jgi:hypothetical protein